MEKEILFINLAKGEKDGKNWFRVDYVICASYRVKSDFLSPLQYERLKKKCENKNLTKCIGIFDINDYDKLVLVDLK